jgi:hypothetical protein
MNIIMRLLLMFVCWVAIFFALAIHNLGGGFLHNAVAAALLYPGVIWLHKLGHGWNS